MVGSCAVWVTVWSERQGTGWVGWRVVRFPRSEQPPWSLCAVADEEYGSVNHTGHPRDAVLGRPGLVSYNPPADVPASGSACQTCLGHVVDARHQRHTYPHGC